MAEADGAKTVVYRKANSEDGTGIFTVLKGAAPEIPFPVGASELENLKWVISTCCASGESWVAIDNNAIVGVVLAKQDPREMFRTKALSLPYIAVNHAFRNQGICSTLIEKLKAKGVPLTASVLHANKSSMADYLEKKNFTEVEATDTETKLKWTPTVTQASTKA